MSSAFKMRQSNQEPELLFIFLDCLPQWQHFRLFFQDLKVIETLETCTIKKFTAAIDYVLLKARVFAIFNNSTLV